MRKVEIHVELDDSRFNAYESEARRRGVAMKQLVEQTVNNLMREMEREELEGTDHPIFPR